MEEWESEKISLSFLRSPTHYLDYDYGGVLKTIVEEESTVYTGMCPRNGSDPMWSFSSSCLGRIGGSVFATGQEKLPQVKPLNDTRWTLHGLSDGGWERLLADTAGLTREPCPMAVFPDGRVFISGNPTMVPGLREGKACPEILEFDAGNPKNGFRRHLPEWLDSFTEHSYRAFAADAEHRELILFQNVGGVHSAWALMTRDGSWLSGRLVWPLYEDPLHEPSDAGYNRVNYMTVSLRDRAVHVCGVSPHNKWRLVQDNPELMGRRWGNRFRRLYYAWTPDIGRVPFSTWSVVDDTEDTGGWLFPGDLHVDDDGAVHLLYNRAPIDRLLRDEHFPDIRRVYSLHYAVLREGERSEQRTLVEGGEGGRGIVPFDLAGEDQIYPWERNEPIRTCRVPTPRFHVTGDGRMFAIFYVSGQDEDGRPVSQNRLMEIGPDGPGETTVVPFRYPLVQYYTATPRAGSLPSDCLDLLGLRTDGLGLFKDVPTTVSYARVRLA